jgi:uncharacterized protein YodC (DUF2158 family)
LHKVCFDNEIFQSGMKLNLIRRFLNHLFGPNSKFSIGEGVELKEGSQIMVIVKISSGPAMEPVIHCECVEPGCSAKVEKMFYESDLRPVDWTLSRGGNNSLKTEQPWGV